MEQANVSQHLAVLRVKQLVSNRKAGNQVFYAVRDPIIIEVLNLMRTYFHAHLISTFFTSSIPIIRHAPAKSMSSSVRISLCALPK
jgi:hypothetical protein